MELINARTRYYQPSFTPSFAPNHVPRSSHDTTLSAFAQLATLRLDSKRALISLIDRANQYILAEATQTLSLQSDLVHNDEDELWFGCTTLPRSRGICEMALEILPSPESQRVLPLIIHDLTQDDKFKHQPFVTSHPSLRFYAATPICTKSGFNIGTLCVMDDRPRDGLSDVEIVFLSDMAITIMAHLEMARVKEVHRRSENMVKGLGLFVEGRSSLREVGSDAAWREQGTIGKVEVQNSKESRPQLNLHSRSTSKEQISVSKTIGSDVAAHFKSPESPSSLSQPEPAFDPRLLLATFREGDGSLTASDRGSQEALPSISATLGRAQDASPIPSTREAQRPTSATPSLRTSTRDLQESMLSENLKEMFSRASNIIRECIEVDGTIFLDASIGTFGGQTGEPHNRLGRVVSMEGQNEESFVSTSEDERLKTHRGGVEKSQVSPADGYESQRPGKLSTESGDKAKRICGVLGFSTEEKSSLRRDKASENYDPVAEAFLQRLLQKYPHGHVFNLGGEALATASTIDIRHTVHDTVPAESGSPDRILGTEKPRESTTQAELKALLHMLPGARSVVLFPLWDSHRERWFAGSFAWTTSSTRVLTRAEDLSYLAAFGNSIMAEVARLDAMTADRAKSDFISSISHELRSPLHGILASVEFLQDTTVDLFQNSMIDTIERCGRTLLDTIQHVLDFAKINNFIKPNRINRNVEAASDQGPRSRLMGLSVDIDLSVITEDVIDAVYAGHEFQGNSSLGVVDEASGFPSEGLRRSGSNDSSAIPDQPALKKEQLAVIVDIGWRSNWTFNTQSGALRRVLMNLFGNALKYTDSGWVKVSLQSEDIESRGSPSQQSIITITVSDSGRGISREFLHSRLFTPFSQENSLNPGTGLGLSIVLQIVRSLGGTVDVHSELGVGTEVKVSLPLSQAAIPHPIALSAKHESSLTNVRKKTNGLTLGLMGFGVRSGISETDAGTLRVEPKPSITLQQSLEGMATYWFDMKVGASQSREAPQSDIYIADESESSLLSL
jgi:signal transduction histidine kinase